MMGLKPEWLETRIQPRDMAESEGFEPPIRCRIPDFELARLFRAINGLPLPRSAIRR